MSAPVSPKNSQSKASRSKTSRSKISETKQTQSKTSKSNPVNPLAEFIFLFAHGAGSGKDSLWMTNMANLLSEQGLESHRFNFPYMIKSGQDGKRRPPDRMPKLVDAFIQQIEQLVKLSGDRKIIIGGKSMGGRVASLLGEQQTLKAHIKGIICLGFPFHPPKKQEKYRGDHLLEIDIPTLILQGERDTFGTPEEISGYKLSPKVKLEYLIDGDHSFKPRVKSGVTEQQNMVTAANRMINFLDSI